PRPGTANSRTQTDGTRTWMDVTVSGGAASQGVEAASDVAEGGDPGGRKLEVGEFVVADTAGDDVGDDAISLQERHFQASGDEQGAQALRVEPAQHRVARRDPVGAFE